MNSVSDDKTEQTEEQSSFGFGNLLSSVSSITKLVESTGSKVMIGGLDTLEAIGKKTMEVLQDGDRSRFEEEKSFLCKRNGQANSIADSSRS